MTKSLQQIKNRLNIDKSRIASYEGGIQPEDEEYKNAIERAKERLEYNKAQSRHNVGTFSFKK